MMASKILTLRSLSKLRQASVCNFSSGKILFDNQPSFSSNVSSSRAEISGDVPGLSDSVVKFTNEPVGPGASKDTNYKNPEYFCYNQDSYFEAEVEMLKYRLPQPSCQPPKE